MFVSAACTQHALTLVLSSAAFVVEQWLFGPRLQSCSRHLRVHLRHRKVSHCDGKYNGKLSRDDNDRRVTHTSIVFVIQGFSVFHIPVHRFYKHYGKHLRTIKPSWKLQQALVGFSYFRAIPPSRILSLRVEYYISTGGTGKPCLEGRQ